MDHEDELTPEDIELDDQFEEAEEKDKKFISPKMLIIFSMITFGVLTFLYFFSEDEVPPKVLEGTDLQANFQVDNNLISLPSLSNDINEIPSNTILNENSTAQEEVAPDEFKKLVEASALQLPDIALLDNEKVKVDDFKSRKLNSGILYTQPISSNSDLKDRILEELGLKSAYEQRQFEDRAIENNNSGSITFVDNQKNKENQDIIQKKTGSISAAQAYMIPDRNLFLTKGSFLDCTLETAINSTLSGMVSCRISRNIYSTSGQVVLIERGSRITGQYQGGSQNGLARIYVIWSRVETPNGVMIDISSPGTDPLGRSGHSGYLETHFWKKFGAAMLISFVDTAGKALLQRIKQSTVQLAEATGTQAIEMPIEGNEQLPLKALEDFENRPDILYKNQGEHISIYVANDLDFRSVYELKKQH